jgi:hypothetical protein
MAKELANVIGAVSPEELLRMPAHKLFLYQRGGIARKLEKVDYLKCKELKGKFSPHPMHDKELAHTI